MKYIVSLLLTATLTAALVACSSGEGKEKSVTPASEAIPVNVMALKKESIATPIEASGQFTTDDETYLAFKIGGVIEKIYKKEGDAIRKGELLATLNLTEIDAQVAQAQLAYDKATRDLNRVSNLYRDSVATLEQFQNARTGMDVAAKQLEAARFNRTYATIRALEDGFVLKKLASEGQVISSGTSVFQTNGARKGQWKLRVAVSDRAWSRLAVGDVATITLDASQQSVRARVSRKSEGIDPYTGTFSVELTVTGEAHTLASGLFGKAVITPAKTEDVWVIPFDALLDGHSQNGYVFVTDDNKTARRVPVTISRITPDNIIVNGGLESAATLIISGSAYLKDGSLIRVLN